MGQCQQCGVAGPTAAVSFHHNIGLLLMRFHGRTAGRLCRSCVNSAFLKHSLINLTLGWWGVISFFVTPVFAIMNVVSIAGATYSD